MSTRAGAKRTCFCIRCGRTIGELGFSRTGVPATHKCPHGVRCDWGGPYARSRCDECDKCRFKPCRAQKQYRVGEEGHTTVVVADRYARAGIGPTCKLAAHGAEVEHAWTDR